MSSTISTSRPSIGSERANAAVKLRLAHQDRADLAVVLHGAED
jgi:hypothetical protein